MPLSPIPVEGFGGLSLADPEEIGLSGAADLLNVDLDLPGQVRSRDGYAKLTTSAGATRYDSVFSVANAGGVSSATLFAGAGSNVAYSGGTNWTSPGNITADDNVYATVTATSSNYLTAGTFGFAVPSTATVLGVRADIGLKSSSASVGKTIEVRIVKAGAVTGTAKLLANGVSDAQWPTTETNWSWGGSTDLWGTTLTPTEVNAAGFGVAINGSASSATLSVDYIKITVWYQALTSGAVAGAAASRLDVIDSSGAVTATVATASDEQQTYAAFGSPATSSVYIANRGATIRKLVGTTFSSPAGMPKAKCVALQSPDNRLVAANIATIPTGAGSTASTSLVHFSDAGTPETWGANNYVYLTPGDNEDIQGIVVWRDLLFVFKSTKFFVFYGNSTDSSGNPVFNYRQVTGFGLAAPLGVCAGANGVYFLDRRGVYFTIGGPPTKVSDPINLLFASGAGLGVYQSGAINPAALALVSMAWLADRLYVGVPLGASTANSHTLVFDPPTGRWLLWNIPMGAMAATASQPAKLLFTYATGTNDVGQYAPNTYSDDAGTAISSRYASGFGDLGAPGREKTVKRTEVIGTGTVGVAWARDLHATYPTASNVTLGTSPAVARGMHLKAQRGELVSFKLSGSTAWSVNRVTPMVLGPGAVGSKSTA